MASSRASSPSPSSTPGPGLSAEELAEREVLEMMSSDPPQLESEEDEVDQLSSDQDAPTTPVAPLTPAAGLRNELVYARRKASQLKLHPYQHDAIEEFVKVVYHFRRLGHSLMT